MSGKQAPILVIAMIVGFGVGFAFGNNTGTQAKALEFAIGGVSIEATPDAHGQLFVTKDQLPVGGIALEKDQMQGWNLQVDVDNFEFTPRDLYSDSSPNSGHAHVYVNDVKVARLYSPDFHIGYLPEGEHEIIVRFSTNNHEEIWFDGKVFEMSAPVTVSKDDLKAMDMSKVDKSDVD